MINFLLDLVYTKRCASCGNILDFDDKAYLCKECENHFTSISSPVCEKCGSPNVLDGYCADCRNGSFHFDRNIALFIYDDFIRNAIHMFKYGKKLNQGRSLSLLAADAFYERGVDTSFFDFIIPVPIHKARLKERKFNQAELICEAFSHKLNIPINKKLVKRCVNTISQSRLNPAQRQRNMENVFSINKNQDIKGKNFLIIDDIFTTGSTLNSISLLLKNNGANHIMAVTVAIRVKLKNDESEYD